MDGIAGIMASLDYGPSPEAEGQARAWLAAHEGGFGHFIGGTFQASIDGERFETINPARGELLARIAQGSAADVALAVEAAQAAFPGWSRLPGHARARHLYAIARHLQKRERLFAVVESLDNGKPIRESRDIDVPLAVRHFYHHAGWAELVASEFPGATPVGVCGQIIPWNFPLLMLAWKIAPALAAGNTVVLKPAEFTPLSALLFAEVCVEAGVPPGVVNIVTGDGATGAALVAHPGLRKLAFTGSTEVGRAIRRETAGRGLKLSLELGGKSPIVVFEDADLDSAVEGVVDGIWFNQGQVCCAGSRLLVQEGIAPHVYARLRDRMARLTIGDPLDKSTDIGAIVAPVQLARIASLVETGRREGAEAFQPDTPLPACGTFFPPTLFTGVAPASTIATTEIFGPVLAAMTFRTPDEAVELANNSRYGLAASIWSQDIDRALDVAARVKAGVVWVNCTNQFDAAAGFGGYRESGFGREGGREGMREYLVERAPTPTRVARSRRAALAVPSPEPPWRPSPLPPSGEASAMRDAIDRTAKLYVGGVQARPDGGASYSVFGARGGVVGQAALGNRKDIRNAVEAAARATAWSAATAHQRAQVLYFIAENLAARSGEFAARIAAAAGGTRASAIREVELAIRRAFFYAAWADKHDGRVHATRSRHVTLAMHEPFGVMGVACPDAAPLLALVSMVFPAIALGNRVVAIPSQAAPLPATDLYQVLETSDVPAGVVNIVTGPRDELAEVLAGHDEVAACWYFGHEAGMQAIERGSAGNLKTTWCRDGERLDWTSDTAQGEAFLDHAVQVKNIWIPYGA